MRHLRVIRTGSMDKRLDGQMYRQMYRETDGRTDGQMFGRKDGRTDGWTDGRIEIPPCVLQDIGPLGPLPKKDIE